jgi:hypothetical protein
VTIAPDSPTPDLIDLPIGVHPQDRSVPGDQAYAHDGPKVPLDTAGVAYRKGKAPWQIDNSAALSVFQRLADAGDNGLLQVTATIQTLRVVGRTPGRTSLDLWVPSEVPSAGGMITTPAGVLWGYDEGELQQTSAGFGSIGGVPMGVGDSVRITNEAGVWIATLPGASSGWCAFNHSFDTAGARGGLLVD